MSITDEQRLQETLATKRLREICKSKTAPDMQEVVLLVEAGANINDVTPEGRCMLHELVETNHLDLARYLINKGANLEIRMPDGLKNTPLLYATWSHINVEMAKLFIECGASMIAQDSVGDTALHNAGLKDLAEVVRHALSIREDIQAGMLNNTKRSALANAVSNGHPNTAAAFTRDGWPIDETAVKSSPTYDGMSENHHKTKTLINQTLAAAHDRWIHFLHERHGDVTSLTREDICAFSNIEATDEIFRPRNWVDHKKELFSLMSSLPPWLAAHIISRQPSLLVVLNNTETSVWNIEVQGRVTTPEAEKKRA